MPNSEYAELRALCAIIDEGSFTAASRRLAVSRSALSETIRKLEARLGVQLLNRTTRSVSATEAGATLARRFAGAAAQIDDALRDVQETAGLPVGRVAVHAQRLGYELFLRDSLPRFLAEHPGISVDVRIDDAVVELASGGFDLGIRLRELLDQDLVAFPLGGPLRQIAVASPDYLARHGEPAQPKDLCDHRCITFRWPGHDAIYQWEFARAGSWFQVPVSGPLTLSEQRATVEAALRGVGIAFWVESELRPLIEAGRLRPLLTGYTAEFPGFSLCYPRHRHRSAAVRALIDHLRRAYPIPSSR